jgi:hypothetical protein
MSQKVQVVRFKELDLLQHLTITKPVLHPKTNVYNAEILYQNQLFILETPYVKNPFGVTTYQKGENKCAYSITLMSSGTYTDTQEVITHFFNELKKLDQAMIDYGEKYSEILFGEKKSRNEVEKIYDAGVRGKLDKFGVPYPDKISPKILIHKDKLKIVVFKNSKSPLDIYTIDDLTNIIESGTSLRAIIQPRVYFMKDKFGIVYEYHQIKLPSIVTKNEIKMGIYSFSD